MMRFNVVLALALLASSVTGPVSADSEVERDCGDAAIAAIQRRYETLKDLRANFVQITRAAALGTAPSPEIRSSGWVAFAKPGKMRWSYEEPEPSLVVSDGKTLWIYDPGFREVQKIAVGDGYFSGAGIQFLLGAGEMRRDFVVSVESCSERRALLELTPRRAASYEKLRILADLTTGDLLKTTVIDLFGNVTEISFSDLQTNLEPSPEIFSFDPPADVRVIEVEMGSP